MAIIQTEDEMYIPEDLKGLYDRYLDMIARGQESVTLPIEFVMSLIERVGDLEQDSTNLDSYLHYECRKKLKKELERIRADIQYSNERGT